MVSMTFKLIFFSKNTEVFFKFPILLRVRYFFIFYNFVSSRDLVSFFCRTKQQFLFSLNVLTYVFRAQPIFFRFVSFRYFSMFVFLFVVILR